MCNPDDEFLRGLITALDAIESNEMIPSADVQPVVHAYWIELPKALNPNENPCKDRCSNYMDCDGNCFIDDTPCDCNGNIEKCKGR